VTLQTIAGLAAGFVVLWTVTAACTLAAGSRSSGGFSTSGWWFYATAVTASAAEFLGARYHGSVVSDLMEPLRTIVDEVVLELLTTRELARGSAVDTQVGVCRLGAELARQLAASASQLRSTPVPDVAHLRSRLPAGWVALRYRTRSRIDSTPCSLTRNRPARLGNRRAGGPHATRTSVLERGPGESTPLKKITHRRSH